MGIWHLRPYLAEVGGKMAPFLLPRDLVATLYQDHHEVASRSLENLDCQLPGPHQGLHLRLSQCLGSGLCCNMIFGVGVACKSEVRAGGMPSHPVPSSMSTQ